MIRRIPALISYDKPFDNWLSYREAYYDEQSKKIYRSHGVLYGFKGGVTLLGRGMEL